MKRDSKKDLLTAVMNDLIPFLQERNVDLITALMLVDIHILQTLKETPPQEVLVEYAGLFKNLNALLCQVFVLDLGETEQKLFADTSVDFVVNNPEALFVMKKGPGFIQKRFDVYAKYRPELLELLESIKAMGTRQQAA